MALNLYTGKPGAGKSYSIVANVIIPALLKGRHVVTNIPLQDELMVQVFGGQITQLPLDCLEDPDLPEHIPNGCVAVIDECWNRWPGGQRVSIAPKNDLHWLKEHRHRVDKEGNAMQVVLATQDPSDLASWVRKLIKHTFWMEKLDTLGMDSSFKVKIYQGCPSGNNIPKRYLIRTINGTYDPDICQYYQSATQSQSGTVGDELVMDKRTNIWRSPAFLFQTIGSPILFFGGLAAAYFMLSSVFFPTKKHEEPTVVEAPISAEDTSVASAIVNPPPEPVVAAAPPPAVVQPVAQVVETVPALKASSVWKLSGYIKRSAEPANKDWASRTGYGEMPTPRNKLELSDDYAILTGITGIRYVPPSQCIKYPDGINYSCDIDGERVTPWSGATAITDVMAGSAVSGVREVVTSSQPEPVRKPTSVNL